MSDTFKANARYSRGDVRAARRRSREDRQERTIRTQLSVRNDDGESSGSNVLLEDILTTWVRV